MFLINNSETNQCVDDSWGNEDTETSAGATCMSTAKRTSDELISLNHVLIVSDTMVSIYIQINCSQKLPTFPYDLFNYCLITPPVTYIRTI